MGSGASSQIDRSLLLGELLSGLDAFDETSVIRFFQSIGCDAKHSMENISRCRAADVESLNDLIRKICGDESFAYFLLLDDSQIAIVRSHASSLMTIEGISCNSSPTDIRGKESLDEMIGIMNNARNMVLGISDGDFDEDLSGFEAHENTLTYSDDTLLAWSMPLSSPTLNFSDDVASAWRHGNSGHFPKALVLVAATLTRLSIRLDRAPNRNNAFSFGVADLSFTDHGRNFGESQNSFGMIHRRNRDDNPIEIWKNGKLILQIEESVCEGDTFMIEMDTSIFSCSIYHNGSILFKFDKISPSSQYVIGAVICDDHCVSIIPEMHTIFRADSINQSVNESLFDEGFGIPGDILEEELPASPRIQGDLLIQGDDAPSASTRPVMPPVPSHFPRNQSLTQRSERKRSHGMSEDHCATSEVTKYEISNGKHDESCAKFDNRVLELQESLNCCICLDTKKCVVLMPCRHMCLCEKCGITNSTYVSTCPICRMHIDDRILVFT